MYPSLVLVGRVTSFELLKHLTSVGYVYQAFLSVWTNLRLAPPLGEAVALTGGSGHTLQLINTLEVSDVGSKELTCPGRRARRCGAQAV